ncbi:elmo domain-containing protein 3-like [Stylonychia lemnae]|uniref:Elmo domain-containing protein 3-like n=1 Tax=Stylonychia lemnae TaxID=5949 RepID=A0A078AHY7_STYLE|nr:elmo domain-containing protein 3-like [Stylonychia lemnae]|eukprot:CDW81127.1 elmo domain-containing protein 3-like [Stylonychia lemnae]
MNNIGCFSNKKSRASKTPEEIYNNDSSFSHIISQQQFDPINYRAISQIIFETEREIDMRTVIHIYQQLTQSQQIEHIDWEVIGFQNKENIKSDFRAVGLLGLLNLLYFMGQDLAKVRQIYELSTDKVQNYPFMLACFNITNLTLRLLNNDKITSQLINLHEEKNAFVALQEYYIALLKRFDERWRNEKLKINDFNVTLDQIEIESKKDIVKFIQKNGQTQSSINGMKNMNNSKKQKGGKGLNQTDFSNI